MCGRERYSSPACGLLYLSMGIFVETVAKVKDCPLASDFRIAMPDSRNKAPVQAHLLPGHAEDQSP